MEKRLGKKVVNIKGNIYKLKNMEKVFNIDLGKYSWADGSVYDG